MSKLSVLNSEIFSRRVKEYLVWTVAGIALWNVPSCLSSIGRYMDHNARVIEIENYIEANEFEASREILKAFWEKENPDKAEIASLEQKINIAEKRFEEKKKKFEEEKERLDKEEEKKYANSGYVRVPTRFGMLNLPKQSEIQYNSSDSPSDLIHELNSFANPGIDCSPNRPLEEIISELNQTLTEEIDLIDVLKNLDKFYESLGQRNNLSVDSSILSDFSIKTNTYLSTSASLKDDSLELAKEPQPSNSKIYIIRKLGVGYDGGIQTYAWPETPPNIPIGTVGEYFRSSNTNDGYHLIGINGEYYWFSRYEITNEAGYNKLKNKVLTLREIKNRVEEIKTLLTTREIQNYCESIIGVQND